MAAFTEADPPGSLPVPRRALYQARYFFWTGMHLRIPWARGMPSLSRRFVAENRVRRTAISSGRGTARLTNCRPKITSSVSVVNKAPSRGRPERLLTTAKHGEARGSTVKHDETRWSAVKRCRTSIVEQRPWGPWARRWGAWGPWITLGGRRPQVTSKTKKTRLFVSILTVVFRLFRSPFST